MSKPVQAHGYDWIVAWGRYLGSHNEYIQDECDQALADEAPVNAIFKREDGWHTTDGITNPRTRQTLGLDPLPREG